RYSVVVTVHSGLLDESKPNSLFKGTMMKCDIKTMLKTGIGLGAVVAVAYATFPIAREWNAASTPFLFFMICPLMMVFMMKGMQSCDKEQRVEKDQAHKTPSAPLIGQSQLKD